MRGPLLLRGPLRARLAPPSGGDVALADSWLAEGVLRCGLLSLAPPPPPPPPQPTEAGREAGGEAALAGREAGGEAALAGREAGGEGALAGAFCELHGASAVDEVGILVT